MPGVFAVRTGGGEAFELEVRGSLGKQVGQRVGHGVERVAGDAAPGRDVDGDARGVPRQPPAPLVTGQVRMLEFSREMIV